MHPNDKLITALLFILILLGVGTAAYSNLESWSYVDSFYFTAMTITTVGYGDLVPTTDISKLFTVLFSFGGISIVLVILVTLGGEYYKKEQRAIRKSMLSYLENRKQKRKVERRRRTVAAKRRGRGVQVSRREKISHFFNR